MLSREGGMTTPRRLLTVVGGLGRSEAFGDESERVLANGLCSLIAKIAEILFG